MISLSSIAHCKRSYRDSFVFPTFLLLSLTSLAAFGVVSLYLKEIPKPEKASLKLQMTTLFRYMRNSRFVKTVFLIVVFYALINVYYSFLSVFLNGEGIPIPLIGVILYGSVAACSRS